ncbi:CoA transferase [Nocardia aurantia]
MVSVSGIDSGETSQRVRDWAESGVPALTGYTGGPSLIPPGSAATIARRHTAYIAAATGDRVRLDGARLLSERAAYTGFTRGGTLSAGRHCRLLPTADGWAAVSCARPDDPLLLGALVCRDVGNDPWPHVADWLRTHTGAELVERAELLGLAAAPVTTPAEAVDRHTARTEPAAAGTSTSDRHSTHIAKTSSVAGFFAPETLVPRPVDGLRVVDFSALWAGPLCAHLLGLAGARIIKVETPTRPDGARRGDPGFYRLLHAGHESVVLDPNDPGQRAALADLVASADIVIEASRPRALAGFGLDARAFADSGGTWLSITAHGRASNRVGFGDDVAAGAGLVARTADGTPLFVGDAIADPLTGLTAAALAMSAPTGSSGRLWDIAMSSVVAATLDTGATADPIEESLIIAPSRRAVTGAAPDSGRDTVSVLTELGRWP